MDTYFVCQNRHKGQGCDLPYLLAEQVEDHVERAWIGERIDAEELAALREDLRHYLADEGQDRAKEADRLGNCTRPAGTAAQRLVTAASRGLRYPWLAWTNGTLMARP
jgi:hypothetical protein